MTLRLDHLSLLTDTNEKNQEIADFFATVLELPVRGNAGAGYSEDVAADIEAIRARGGNVVLEPMETDWGSTSAYVAGPHGVLVEVCKMH